MYTYNEKKLKILNNKKYEKESILIYKMLVIAFHFCTAN